MTSVRIIVHGHVQGVGFRWFARATARANGVVGWVRNLSDGTVEAELSGDSESVRTVIDALRAGPESARVDRVDESTPDPRATSDFAAPTKDFEIRG